MCPDLDKKKKKSPKRHTDKAGKKDRGDSANQRIGLFTTEEMRPALTKLRRLNKGQRTRGRNLNSPGMRSVRNTA